MKRLVIILAMLAVSVSALAQSGRQLYSKYSDLPGTEAVYVSPAMFRLIGKIPDVEMQDGSVNFGPIIKSLSGLYILNIPKSDAAAQLADAHIYSRRLSATNKMFFDSNATRHIHLYDRENHTYREVSDDQLLALVTQHLKHRKFRGYSVEDIDIQLIARPTRKNKSL